MCVLLLIEYMIYISILYGTKNRGGGRDQVAILSNFNVCNLQMRAVKVKAPRRPSLRRTIQKASWWVLQIK